MLTDTEFEHMIREAGYKPTLLQLGCTPPGVPQRPMQLGVRPRGRTGQPKGLPRHPKGGYTGRPSVSPIKPGFLAPVGYLPTSSY